MILEPNEILERINKPQNQHIPTFKKNHRILNMLLTGHGLEEHISLITGIESEKKLKLRKKYTRSAKDILSHILANTNKLFSARGGYVTIDITNDVAKEKLIEALDDITENKSLNSWLESNFLTTYHMDPNGLYFVETPKADDAKKKHPYPTYKSISCIHDYETFGQELEYVIFEPFKALVGDKEQKIYRVVDDLQDALYYVDGEQLNEFQSDEHPFAVATDGKVPAVVISQLLDVNTKGKLSILDTIVELLIEYIVETGVKSVFKKLHGYPVFYRYVTDCRKCKGTGYVDDGDDMKDCSSCHGTGKNLDKDVSDTMDFSMPESKESAIVTPDAAGYISPSVETWAQMTSEQKFMIDLLNLCYWNATVEKSTNETATGRFIDVQPIYEKLNIYASGLEIAHRGIINIIGEKMYPEYYKDAIVVSGRRFLVETPDQIWEKYCEAKNKQASVVVLNFLFEQFLYAEFQGDSEMIEQKRKEHLLEPYPHYTLDQLISSGMQSKAQEKLLFSDWLIQAENLDKEFKILLNERDAFINQKLKDETSKEAPPND